MVKRTFDPGFRIELHQKDLNLALNSARALGVSLPLKSYSTLARRMEVKHGITLQWSRL
nr:NAD-binding protein [Polynucleobacter necessarius]